MVRAPVDTAAALTTAAIVSSALCLGAMQMRFLG